MSEVHTMMMSLTIYKLATIFTGLAFAFMGYRLFISGIFAEAGELRTNWDNRSLVLRKAAPGTFFALLGAVITCISLWRGLNLEPVPRPGDVESGMFSQGTSTISPRSAHDSSADNPKADSSKVDSSRATVLEDIAYLNQFCNDLVKRKDEPARLTTSAEGDRIIDLFDRAKAALMLSAWSPEWGNREEFRKWVAGVYPYSEPPDSIAPAAAIYKGKTR